MVQRRLRANISPVKTKHCSHKEPFYGLISCQRPRHAAFEVSSEPSELSMGQAVMCVCVCVRMFVYLPDRRQKKEGEEVYGKSCTLHPGVCPCEGEIFVSPERKVCFLSVLMF